MIENNIFSSFFTGEGTRNLTCLHYKLGGGIQASGPGSHLASFWGVGGWTGDLACYNTNSIDFSS